MHSNGGTEASEPTLVAGEPRGYHVYHDSASLYSVSETIIEAIAAIRSSDPTDDLIPLTDVVDPDALNSLFADTHTGSKRNEGHIVFSVNGFDVFVHANGHIFIRERQGT
ncbi:HalOD1 output domain-containing protein [Haladaptatus caseinilyticus]|uniref:HalOD1 output domain-containing protein n=1 Tax=Haladaptatus caseinilyticus TaxID=2993314 RepID=UPI00224ADA03|nr:HalOD1 output domain-containing protein [Haladaptatus caseinilyticus]